MNPIEASFPQRAPAAGLPSRPWSLRLKGAVLRAAGRGLSGPHKERTVAAHGVRPVVHPYAANRAALYSIGDAMIAAAHARREPVTALMFEQSDLPELHAIFGSAAARALTARFNEKLQELAGDGGQAIRSDATTWTVLLPGRDAAPAMAAVRRVFGPLPAVELEGSEDEILLVPHLALHTVGREIEPMRRVYLGLGERIARAHRQELLRQEFLRRERESHSSRPADF